MSKESARMQLELPDDVWEMVAEAIVNQGGLGTWPDQHHSKELASGEFPLQRYKESGALGARFVCRGLWRAVNKLLKRRYKLWLEMQKMWYGEDIGMHWWLQIEVKPPRLPMSMWWLAEMWIIEEVGIMARLEKMTPHQRKTAYSFDNKYKVMREHFTKNLALLGRHMKVGSWIDGKPSLFGALSWDVLKWLNDLLYRILHCPRLEGHRTTLRVVKSAWNEVLRGTLHRNTTEGLQRHREEAAKQPFVYRHGRLHWSCGDPDYRERA